MAIPRAPGIVGGEASTRAILRLRLASEPQRLGRTSRPLGAHDQAIVSICGSWSFLYGRAAARLKARSAITTRASRVPNTVASIFGLRILCGSNGFLGSRNRFKV